MANSNQSTAIAVSDEKVSTQLATWAERDLGSFYRGRDFDVWKNDAVLAIVQNEDLRKLMLNDISATKLMRALQLNATTGLSLNPQLGEAAIIAYNGKKGLEVNHIPMKNGLIKKALQTKKVLKVESGTVYENDIFKATKTSRGDEYEWSIALDNRGNAKGYFAYAKLDDGTTVIEYQAKQQVWEHALKYGKGRVWDDDKKCYLDKFHESSSWGKSFDGMAEKTCVRALLNELHLPELEDVFVDMDRQDEEMRNVTEEPEHKGTGSEDLEKELNANNVTETQDNTPSETKQDDDNKQEELPIF